MFAEGATPGIAGRPDPDSRHGLADGGDNLRRNALRLFRAGLSFFKAGVKLSQGLFPGSLRLAAASGHIVSSPILSLFGSCHNRNPSRSSNTWKDYRSRTHGKRKRPI